MKLGYSRQTLEKSSDFSYHENPSSGSGVVLCGQTDRQMEGRTIGEPELTTPKVAFRNFSNGPEEQFDSMPLGK